MNAILGEHAQQIVRRIVRHGPLHAHAVRLPFDIEFAQERIRPSRGKTPRPPPTRPAFVSQRPWANAPSVSTLKTRAFDAQIRSLPKLLLVVSMMRQTDMNRAKRVAKPVRIQPRVREVAALIQHTDQIVAGTVPRQRRP